MYQACRAIVALAIVVLPPSLVDGHGYLKTPRSRNWLAQEEGPGCRNADPTCPPAEYCPHCLNNNIGVCGKFSDRNYETVNWLNKAGNPMPWVSQYGNTASPSGTFMTTSEYYETEYYEGDFITIDSYLSTHHAGHEEIRACVIDDNDPTSCTLPEHFPDENELIFVEDLVYDTNQREMFKDPAWPGRGYYSGGEAGGTKEFTHRYRLPDGIVGGKVLLQWKYITANSCKPPGYDDYFQNLESSISTDYSSYWKKTLGDCNWPLNNDGATGSGNPEQFFNCAEITILPSGTPSPTSSHQPSPSPTVSTSPTVSHEPTSQEPTNGPTLSAPPTRSPVSGPPPCVAEYADCTYNESNCCQGFTCTQVDMAGYDKRCLSTCNAPGPTTPMPVGYTSPPTPPFATPTTLKPTNFPLPPSPTEACCTLNLKDCKPNDEYCNSDQNTCEGSCGKLWLPTGPSNGCIPLWGGGCTMDDDCCLHAECRPGGQCESDDPWLQNGDSPTPSPTVSNAPSHSPTPEPTSAPVTPMPSVSPSTPIPSKSPSPPPSSAPTTKMPSSSPTTRSPTLSFDATYSDKVRVNQIGYLRYATKIGVIVDDSTVSREFQVQDSTGSVHMTGTTSVYGEDGASEDHVHQADFTGLETLGAYRLVVDGIGSSLEFNIAPNLYPELPYESMNYFYFHRMGTMDIEAEHLIDGRYARAALHPEDDAVPSYNNWCVGCDDFDLQGSWADAGDFGIYTVNHAISAWTLLNLNEMFPTAFEDGSLNLPESGNGFPDVLDEVDYGSRFMRGMLPSNGGLASHKAHNHAWSAFTITVEDENKENSAGTRSAMGQSTPATYAVARVNAQLARMWSSKGGDPTYVATLWDAAEDAYARATSISEKTYDPSDSPGPAIGGGDYPDGQISDDKYAAACEMYLTALALGKSNVGTYKTDVTSSNHFQQMGQWDWATVTGAGTLSLYAVNNDLSAAHMQTIEDNIVSFANSIATAIETEGYPSNLSFLSIGQYPWGSNSFIMNRMIALAYAYEITGSDTYQHYLMRSMDYIMGTNAMDISYVTGYGEKAETDTHDRWAWTIGQDAFWPKGWLSGGPNNELINDNATPYAAAAKSYAEPGTAPQAWGSKENTINWNAPLAWVSCYIDNKVTPNLGGCDGNCNPLAKSFSGKLQMDTSIQLNLEASDYDGSVDTWEIASSPMFGSLSGDLPNVIYTPDNGAIGTDTFTFTVTDNDGGVSNVATVSLLVRDCDLLEVFQVPAAYPAYSGGYKYVHVSEDGPSLGQMKETAHNVQWTGSQLHQFSLEPDYDPYYKNLPDDCMINQALSGPAASFTLSGCGFNGLDGDYWITSSKDGNEVWVEKNNGWAIVFSNDASYTPEFCRSSSPVTSTSTQGTVSTTTEGSTSTTQAPPDTTTQATLVTTTAETTTIASTTSSTSTIVMTNSPTKGPNQPVTPSPTPLPTNQPVTPPSPPPVGGGEVCCTDRNLGYQTCNSNSWCQESPGNCSNCDGVMMSVPLVRNGCCSWSGQDCSGFDPSSNYGCQMLESDCISDCGGTWQPF